jgi:hypothetical protein
MGPEGIIPVFWAFLGILTFAFLALCICFGAAQPYTVPTLVFSSLGSAAVAVMHADTPHGPTSFSWLTCLGTFFFVGCALGIFALSIRALRERHT